MRTSGASLNDTYLVIMTIGIALLILIVLSGGPRQFLSDVERITRGVLDILLGAIRMVAR